MTSNTDSNPDNTSPKTSGLGSKIRGTFETVHGLGESLRAQGMSTLDNFLGTTDKNDEHAKIAEKGKQEVESGMARLRGRPIGAGKGSGPQNADYRTDAAGDVGTGAQSDHAAVANHSRDSGGGVHGAVNPGQEKPTLAGDDHGNVGSAGGDTDHSGEKLGHAVGSGGGTGYDVDNTPHTSNEMGGEVGPIPSTKDGSGAQQRDAGLRDGMRDRENPSLPGSSPGLSGTSDSDASPRLTQSPGSK